MLQFTLGLGDMTIVNIFPNRDPLSPFGKTILFVDPQEGGHFIPTGEEILFVYPRKEDISLYIYFYSLMSQIPL